MLSTFFPSIGARLNRDGKPTTYFYRPKFLLAPDPSTLAHPGRFVARKDHHYMKPAGNPKASCRPSDAFSEHRGVRSFNVATFTRVHGTWKFVTAGANVMFPISPGEHKVPLPSPPTLADIQRMEPDLSPNAALMRAGDYLEPITPPGNTLSTDTLVGDLTLPDAFPPAANASPRSFRIVVENSPIVREQRVSQACDMRGVASLSLQRESIRITASPPVQYNGAVEGPSPSASEDAANPSCITVSPEITEQDKANYKALAWWLADYLHAVLSQDQPSSCTDFSGRTRHYTADKIYGILRCTLPSISSLFLAIWYIGRLPVGFVDSQVFWQYKSPARLSIEEVIIRTFIVGSILANKWLQDCNFSAKSWHVITSLPLGLINRLEMSALVALDYRIGISSKEWKQWLIDIRAYHSSLARLQPISRNLGAPYVLIRQLIDEALRIHQDTCPRQEAADKVSVVPDSSTRSQNSPLPEFIGGTPSSSVLPCTRAGPPSDLPLPAPWHPEADPIVFKASRTLCIAPGIHRVQKSFTTMSTFVADSTHGPRGLSYVMDMLTWRERK